MSEPIKPGADLREAVQRKGSFLQTLRAVAWSFFGVRKGRDHEKDLQLNPLHVIVAGVAGAATGLGGGGVSAGDGSLPRTSRPSNEATGSSSPSATRPRTG